MSGLRARMEAEMESLAQELDGGRFDEMTQTGMRSRVRRGRTLRAARTASLAAVVVAVVGVAAWGVAGRTTQPTPATTPTQTKTPAPAPTETPELVKGDPITELGLPTYYTMPDGLVEQMGSGWLLTIEQRSTVGVDGADLGVEPTSTVFVVSPDGTHYWVNELPANMTVVPLEWSVGESRVRVSYTDVPDDGTDAPDEWEVGWLDLTSGAITVDSAGWRAGELAAFAGRSQLSPAIDPSGTWAVSGSRASSPEESVTTVTDVATGTTTTLDYGLDGKTCSPVAWLDSSSFLSYCLDNGWAETADLDEQASNPALFRTVVGSGSATSTLLTTIGESDPRPSEWSGAGVRVRDGVVAFVGHTGSACWDGPCGAGAYLWDGTSITPLQHSDDLGLVEYISVENGLVYITSDPTSGEGRTIQLQVTANDLTAGTSTVIVPAVPEPWNGSLLSYVVAGES